MNFGQAITLALLLFGSNGGVAQVVTPEIKGQTDKPRQLEEATSIFLQATREQELTLDDVAKIVDHFDCFQEMPDRSGVNPFTNEPVMFVGEGRAVYVEDGEAKGNFSLEDGRLLFTGVPEDIAKDAAALVSARIESWDNY